MSGKFGTNYGGGTSFLGQVVVGGVGGKKEERERDKEGIRIPRKHKQTYTYIRQQQGSAIMSPERACHVPTGDTMCNQPLRTRECGEALSHPKPLKTKLTKRSHRRYARGHAVAVSRPRRCDHYFCHKLSPTPPHPHPPRPPPPPPPSVRPFEALDSATLTLFCPQSLSPPGPPPVPNPCPESGRELPMRR